MKSMIALLMTAVGLATPAAADQLPTKKLITAFDCTREYGPDTYFGYGDVRVTRSATGTYREAGSDGHSRFGYRFAVEHVGRPHLAVIRYPEDKTRTMAIMDGSSYDLSVAVFAGATTAGGGTVNLPTSGEMVELRQIFWPRWRDCSIVFGNTVADRPAAAASVTIYELEDLPPLEVPGDPNDGSRRILGVQFEDPCGAAAELGATDRRVWIERMIKYGRYSGQNTLTYPLVWYHGPVYPSEHEPVNYVGMYASSAPDRKLFSHWSTKPDDWVAALLERFGEEQMQFRASLPLMRLGSLMEKMNIDLESIKAGEDTINNMTFKDQVQMGTYDWTLPYNLRNFPKLIDEVHGERGGGPDFQWAYGEKERIPDGFRGPIFNPLHPTVQEAVIGLVQEIVDRYGEYPAFRGIDIFFWETTILWFGSLRSGYDDYTVALFEQETGIDVPVDDKAPDRFSQRYAFLTGDVKEKWVAWRCEKTRDLLLRLRDVVVKARPDLQLSITMQGFDVPRLREAGIDVTLLADQPGFRVFCQTNAEPPPVRAPPQLARSFDGVWNFNRWIEIWGKHNWGRLDQKLRETATIMGKPAEGVMHENLQYPKDDFWWDQQWRVTPVYQSGIDFLQHHACSLADYDALYIARGGLTLDTGHAEMIRPFALAYRALPAKKFETIGDSTDPVAVRTLVDDGKRYVYAVNRRREPVSVELQLAKSTGTATDLATGQSVEAPEHWTIKLGPYQLRSFGLPPEVEITGATVPREDPRGNQPKVPTLVTVANPTITAAQSHAGPGADWDADNVFENELSQDTTPANGVPDHLDFARGTDGCAPVNLGSTYTETQEYASDKSAASDAFIEFDFGKPVRLDGWSFWDRTIGLDSSHRVSLSFSTDATFDADDTVIQFDASKCCSGQSVQQYFSFPTQTVQYIRYAVAAGPIYDGAGEIRFYQARRPSDSSNDP